ncbi:DEAD-box ATP-dependent RNA helicase 47, mitochondrial-like [Chenopodium quinoa]|uniref:RNA helicase n=1 Tax=Chenopodium quinoa TaxID=63459 RepID=A0A803N809_CHEQI|nr:DEAD-box ATP-dependent RNA helicase 47, mitochondrial-like [Chenopodium quinoa]
MPAIVSSRLLILVGESLPFGRLLHVSRNACYYHRNVRFLSRYRHDNGPLTLATLGFRDSRASKESEVDKVRDTRTSKGSEVDSFGQLNPAFEVPKRKAKTVRVKETVVKDCLEIEGAPFAANSFTEIGLPPLLLKRLEEEGFTVPTDVQSTAVPTVLKGHDVVIQSYTGSGKTLAYLLPILSEVGPLKKQSATKEDPGKKKDVEAVIVAPSRELGMQIVREVEKLLGPADKRMVQQLVGGANRSRQEEALKKNKPAIVVGTPGRIAEISAAGKLHTHGCRFLVLDEVDELLAYNFREDMHRILEHVGKKRSTVASQHGNSPRVERQTIMVSATMPISVVRAAMSWGRDPLLVRAKSISPIDSASTSGPVTVVNSKSSSDKNSPSQASSESLPPLLKHYYCTARLQHKVDTLRRCVHALDAKFVIVFMNLNRQLKDTVHKLEARGINAAELHGDLNKLTRSTVLKKFKNGELRILVTNELAARGLDIAECDLVVNFDLPTDSIHYAHRAGRTGRLGRKGVVVSICEQHEVFVMKKIQKQLGVAIHPCNLVEGKLIQEEEEKH